MGTRCAVASCNNYSKKTKKTPGLECVVYHRFPKDEMLCRQWIKRCQKNFGCGKNSFLKVCSEHFTTDDYEIDLKSVLLDSTPRFRLKTSAVPSINLGLPSVELKEAKNRSREWRRRKRDNKKLVEELLSAKDYPVQRTLGIKELPEIKVEPVMEGGEEAEDNFLLDLKVKLLTSKEEESSVSEDSASGQSSNFKEPTRKEDGSSVSKDSASGQSSNLKQLKKKKGVYSVFVDSASDQSSNFKEPEFVKTFVMQEDLTNTSKVDHDTLDDLDDPLLPDPLGGGEEHFITPIDSQVEASSEPQSLFGSGYKENTIDANLIFLKEVTNKLEVLSDKLAAAAFSDAYDQFGKYIATILRGLPKEKVCFLKKQIVDSVFLAKTAQEQKSSTEKVGMAMKSVTSQSPGTVKCFQSSTSATSNSSKPTLPVTKTVPCTQPKFFNTHSTITFSSCGMVNTTYPVTHTTTTVTCSNMKLTPTLSTITTPISHCGPTISPTIVQKIVPNLTLVPNQVPNAIPHLIFHPNFTQIPQSTDLNQIASMAMPQILPTSMPIVIATNIPSASSDSYSKKRPAQNPQPVPVDNPQPVPVDANDTSYHNVSSFSHILVQTPHSMTHEEYASLSNRSTKRPGRNVIDNPQPDPVVASETSSHNVSSSFSHIIVQRPHSVTHEEYTSLSNSSKKRPGRNVIDNPQPASVVASETSSHNVSSSFPHIIVQRPHSLTHEEYTSLSNSSNKRNSPLTSPKPKRTKCSSVNSPAKKSLGDNNVTNDEYQENEYQLDFEEDKELSALKTDEFAADIFSEQYQVKEEPPDEYEAPNTSSTDISSNVQPAQSFTCTICPSSHSSEKELRLHHSQCHQGIC